MLALRFTGWCHDKWNSSTSNLPRKRRDITGKWLNWRKAHIKQSIHMQKREGNNAILSDDAVMGLVTSIS